MQVTWMPATRKTHPKLPESFFAMFLRRAGWLRGAWTSEEVSHTQKIKNVVIQSDIEPLLRHICRRMIGRLRGKHEDTECLVDWNLGRQKESIPATISI